MNPSGNGLACSAMEQKMTDYGTTGMKTKGTRELFLYWNRLRGKRRAPARAEIEPADIRTLLQDTFILEEDSRGQGVFRLAGTRLCAVFGRELKGFVFASLWSDRNRRLVARLMRNTFHDNAVVVVGFTVTSRNDRTCDFELIMLPLDSDGEGARVLGAAVAVDRPFWIGVDPIVECRMTTVRVVDPDREPVFLKNRPEISVPPLDPVDRSIEEERVDGNSRRVRHLLVLDGGVKD